MGAGVKAMTRRTPRAVAAHSRPRSIRGPDEGDVTCLSRGESDASLPEILPGRLYDYPAYCDLLFRSNDRADWLALEHCFEHDGGGTIGRVLEAASGSGRLMIRFARSGFAVEGIDENAAALGYCNGRLRRAGFPPSAHAGDIANFSVKRRFDAVICMLNGFRHLLTEDAARSHLASVACALRPGGLYALGLELTPTVLRDSRSLVTRGRVTLISRLIRRSVDVRRRVERRELEVDVYTPTRWRRIKDTILLRTYSAEQLGRLVRGERRLELVRTLDVDRLVRVPPPPIGPATERAVFVLRRRAPA